MTLHFDVQQARVGVAVRLSQLFTHMREREGLLEEIDYIFLDRSGQLIYSSDKTLLPLGGTLSVDELEPIMDIDGKSYMTEFTYGIIFYIRKFRSPGAWSES